MPEVPAEAADAAEAAIRAELRSSREVEPDVLALVALEAAAPILAEAWGVGGTKPRHAGSTSDPRARIACRRCGAAPGQSCVTSSGSRAPMVHAERRNDWRRAEGQTTHLEREGAYLDRFPPPAARQ